MAIRNIPVKRGGTGRDLTVGIREDGQSKLFYTNQELHPVHELPIKRFPKRLIVDFDEEEGDGGVVRIQTNWRESMASANGKPIQGTGYDLPMTSKQMDVMNFISRYGLPILLSMVNGEVMAIEGYSDKPVFDENGAVISYTAAQEDEPPLRQYHPSNEPAEPTE